MAFSLIISERATGHIENIVSYAAVNLQNPGAAKAILVDIEKAYEKLEYMAESPALCQDLYLAQKGYRKIMLDNHEYVILYTVDNQEVRIAGVFHRLENYVSKI